MSCGGWGWTPGRWDFCSYYRHNRCFYTPNIEDVPSQTVFWWIVQKKQKMLCFFLISSFFCSLVFVCFENKSHVISPFIALMMSFPIDWTFLHRPCTDHWQVVGRTASSSSIWSPSFKITAKIGRLCTYIHGCISAHMYIYIYIYNNIYMYIYIYRWSKYLFYIFWIYYMCISYYIHILYSVCIVCGFYFSGKITGLWVWSIWFSFKRAPWPSGKWWSDKMKLGSSKMMVEFPCQILAEKYKKKSP